MTEGPCSAMELLHKCCIITDASTFVVLSPPEYASHSQRNLALGHHLVVDVNQQILNETNKSLQDKQAQPQIHDELTRHTSPLTTH